MTTVADTSAAWVLAIVVTVAGGIFSLLATVLDPFMQYIFGSTLWTSSTTIGTDALGWGQDFWTYLAVIVLLSFLTTVWIRTRQPT